MAIKNYQELKTAKGRYWCVELYPESAPPLSEWKDYFTKLGLPSAWILHDRDTYECDQYDSSGNLVHKEGDPKKFHYHGILIFPGPTTFKNVERIQKTLNQPMPFPCYNVRKAYEYLMHKNNPEKFQYPESDIFFLNGFDPKDPEFNPKTMEEVDNYKTQLLDVILELGISEYPSFLKFVEQAYPDDPMFLHYANSFTNYFHIICTSVRTRKAAYRSLCAENKKNGLPPPPPLDLKAID